MYIKMVQKFFTTKVAEFMVIYLYVHVHVLYVGISYSTLEIFAQLMHLILSPFWVVDMQYFACPTG